MSQAISGAAICCVAALLVGPARATRPQAENVGSTTKAGMALPLLAVPGSLIGFDSCVDDPADPDDFVVKTVVRVAIPANLSKIVDEKRLVRVSSISQNGGDDEDVYERKNGKKAQQNDPNPNDNDYHEFAINPFHIAVKDVIDRTAGETHLEVRVFFKGDKFAFLTKADRSPPIRGVAYELDKPGKDWLCQKDKPISYLDAVGRPGAPGSKPKRSMVTFFIKRDVKEIASINFLIGADSSNGAGAGGATPILIDPRIKNDGAP